MQRPVYDMENTSALDATAKGIAGSPAQPVARAAQASAVHCVLAILCHLIIVVARDSMHAYAWAVSSLAAAFVVASPCRLLRSRWCR